MASVIIAGIYELEKKIGAGGGGIVYLGRHTRLNKQVVLKADKRKLSAGEEKLRHEVDLLKDLSHTYIPQVYDFVQVKDMVYTVMDYVEGESLDKLLDRGQTVPQRMAVKWACQLLEALSYLHSQKPYGILHGDIKPANIMLRPDGDICLIDFNIALALGEEGAVRAGYSKGYASPEQYISDPVFYDQLTKMRNASKSSAQNRRQEGRKIYMDARSDLYSLGATLYRLLTGQMSVKWKVDEKLLCSCCSPQVAAIIQKSMAAAPERRYQTAEDMLEAFLHLRTGDDRVRRNRKRFVVLTAASAALFLLGGAFSFIGMKQTQNYQSALKLASYSQASFADGDLSAAVDQAVRALDTGKGLFRAPIPAQAQKALTDALGVYDLTDGFKAEDIVKLPAAPFGLEVSPEGSRYAVMYAYEAAIYPAGGKEPLAVRKIRKSAQSGCLFLDEDTVIYAGEQGVEAYNIASGKVLWTGVSAGQLALSGSREVAAVLSPQGSRVVLYRTADGEVIGEYSFKGRHIPASDEIYVSRSKHIFALDTDGKWLAASFMDGGLSLIDTADPEHELVLYEASGYDTFSGGFSGSLFAYTAQGTGQNFFGVLDLQGEELAGGMESRDRMLVRTDENGICLSDGNLLARFEADTLKETELAYTEGEVIRDFDVKGQFAMAVTEDHTLAFYDSGANLISRSSYDEPADFVKLMDGYALAADSGEPRVRVMRLDGHSDTQIFSYEADYVHQEARVSGDGNLLMLFGYEGFRIYDRDGNMTAQHELQEAEQIYDQQYIRSQEASYLEVTWKDGMVRQYGMDGRLRMEEKHEAPDQSLTEEFVTDRYRIVSRLNEPLEVYDRKTGRLAAQLDQDANLTYVTQLDGYIMMEYVSTELERYGILLNEDLEQLAELPGLCDVYGDTVVFDYQNGTIRSSSIYSLDMLTDLAKSSRT